MPDPEVLVERAGRLGHIVLNRPAAINALTHPMVLAIAAAMREWGSDDSVETVLLTGAGERGLCAGGDIVGIYDSAKSGGDEAASFWADEYELNTLMAHYPKPYLAIMDGVVLGGGVGVSAHGSVRVVTERTKLGMPEVGIGFTPDVGCAWLLSRAPGELGTHLALTGTTMGGADAIALGFADHFVPADRLAALVAALTTMSAAAAIAECAVPAPASTLATQREWIDAGYAGDDASAIVRRLAASPVEAARDAAATILTKSPTSIAVTLEALRRARGLDSLEAVLDQDYRLGLRFLETPDLLEGIRAQVIDKDRNPKWTPASLADVARGDVAKYFADLGVRERRNA